MHVVLQTEAWRKPLVRQSNETTVVLSRHFKTGQRERLTRTIEIPHTVNELPVDARAAHPSDSSLGLEKSVALHTEVDIVCSSRVDLLCIRRGNGQNRVGEFLGLPTMERNLRLIDDVTRRIEENDLSGELALPRGEILRSADGSEDDLCAD